MNNMALILAADGTNTWNIVMQYLVYGIIIVVSIALLILLRKRTRLPRHGELKKKLTVLLDEITALKAGGKRMDFIKGVSRTMYKADNMAYTATMLSEKERYSDLGRIANLLESARSELFPYKYGKKEPDDDSGLNAAADKIRQALNILDGVILRDGEMKRGKN